MKTTLKASFLTGMTAFSALCYGQGSGQAVCPQAPVAGDCKQSIEHLFSANTQFVFGNDRFVAVAPDGTLRCSMDGVGWNSVYTPVNDFIRGVTFGCGQFVAVGGSYAARSSIILTSRNGCRWTLERCPTRQVLHAIAYGNSRFVIVGAEGVILSSYNGYRWHKESPPTDATLAAVAFRHCIFVVGGDDGLRLSSRDGLRWTAQESGTRLYISRIAYEDDRFHTSSNVLQLRSNDGIAWEQPPKSNR